MSCEIKDKIAKLEKLIQSNEKSKENVLENTTLLSSAVILQTINDMLELQAKDLLSLERQLTRALEIENRTKTIAR